MDEDDDEDEDDFEDEDDDGFEDDVSDASQRVQASLITLLG